MEPEMSTEELLKLAGGRFEAVGNGDLEGAMTLLVDEPANA